MVQILSQGNSKLKGVGKKLALVVGKEFSFRDRVDMDTQEIQLHNSESRIDLLPYLHLLFPSKLPLSTKLPFLKEKKKTYFHCFPESQVNFKRIDWETAF